MENKELSVISFSNESVKAKGIIGGNDLLQALKNDKSQVTAIAIDVIKDNMVKTLDGLMKVFESAEFDNRDFLVDEIEVSLLVGNEGSVHILSVSGQANVQSSIVVKLKNRCNKDE